MKLISGRRAVALRPAAHSKPVRAALLVAAAAALWGSIGVAVKVAYGHGLSAIETSLWRAGGAFILLFAGVLLIRPQALRVHRRDLPLFAAYGLLGVAVFMTVYFTAVRLSSVATAAMLLYTAPAWVTVLARVFFAEPLGPRKVAAVLLTVAGSALVVRAYDPAALRLSLGGVAAGLAAGFTYALYSIFGKSALHRYRPLTTVLYALGFGFLFLLIAAGGRPALPPPRALPVIVYLILVPTLLAYLLYVAGLARMEAGRASILATVEPVVAAALGVIMLGERLEGWQWIGGGLTLGGIVLIQRDRAQVPTLPPRGGTPPHRR